MQNDAPRVEIKTFKAWSRIIRFEADDGRTYLGEPDLAPHEDGKFIDWEQFHGNLTEDGSWCEIGSLE